jgi:hypothetical protein
MFKDSIHVDDYGSIKETLFKFPSMTKVIKFFNQIKHYRTLLVSPIYTCSVMTLIQRYPCAMMSMRMSGL